MHIASDIASGIIIMLQDTCSIRSYLVVSIRALNFKEKARLLISVEDPLF